VAKRVWSCRHYLNIYYLVYQIFGTAEIQSWNKELPTHDDADEGKILSKPKEAIGVV